MRENKVPVETSLANWLIGWGRSQEAYMRMVLKAHKLEALHNEEHRLSKKVPLHRRGHKTSRPLEREEDYHRLVGSFESE